MCCRRAVRHFSAIDAAPQADLAIVAHTGLDHLDSAAAVWKGIPLRARCGSPGGGSRPETALRPGRPHGMAECPVGAGG